MGILERGGKVRAKVISSRKKKELQAEVGSTSKLARSLHRCRAFLRRT